MSEEWSDESLQQAAEHLKKCTWNTGTNCAGRFPDYDTCSVADLAAECIKLRAVAKAAQKLCDDHEAWCTSMRHLGCEQGVFALAKALKELEK